MELLSQHKKPQDLTKTEAILEKFHYSVFLKLIRTSFESVNSLFKTSDGLSKTEKIFLVNNSFGQEIISLNLSSWIAFILTKRRWKNNHFLKRNI
ncbi:hypothetical protein NPA08_02300 [Mycoplasmopsis citelli]|uniref:hypothetical protein n=1 Tax=Mycoplasmopsis citelli TaxID=171281 RepID=UPI002114022D|nr:hypothetical protein [Mycoplasmopsis citelli]UUD35778.1 hypothetical protein NPA08_02300 [Mycoplasmopsis citelli]